MILSDFTAIPLNDSLFVKQFRIELCVHTASKDLRRWLKLIDRKKNFIQDSKGKI